MYKMYVVATAQITKRGVFSRRKFINGKHKLCNSPNEFKLDTRSSLAQGGCLKVIAVS